MERLTRDHGSPAHRCGQLAPHQSRHTGERWLCSFRVVEFPKALVMCMCLITSPVPCMRAPLLEPSLLSDASCAMWGEEVEDCGFCADVSGLCGSADEQSDAVEAVAAAAAQGVPAEHRSAGPAHDGAAHPAAQTHRHGHSRGSSLHCRQGACGENISSCMLQSVLSRSLSCAGE